MPEKNTLSRGSSSVIEPIATSVSAVKRPPLPPRVTVNVPSDVFAPFVLTVIVDVLEYKLPPFAMVNVPNVFRVEFVENVCSAFSEFAVVKEILAPVP